MGIARVFQRSIRFTFRTKRRFVVFLLIFGIISTLIAFNIDELDSLQTDDLLEQKGVVTERVEGANITYTQTNALYEAVIQYTEREPDLTLEAAVAYYYKDIDNFLRFYTIDIANPWASTFSKPSLLQSGTYPDEKHEILVPDGSFQKRNVSTSSGIITVETELTVGQKLTFRGTGDPITLEIAGTFDGSRHPIVNDKDQLWLFMNQNMYEEVLSLFGFSMEDSLGYMTAYVVEGLVLSKSTHNNVNKLNEHIKNLLPDETSYGNWRDVPTSLPLNATIDRSNQILVVLGFVVIGGIMLSVLFAYLLSRFRRREIAILKAMGYGHSAVRASLYGELLTVSFLGFVVGLGSAQLLLLGLNDFQYDLGLLIRWQAIAAAFFIMVIISLPGMFITSRRILGVSPAEAFRDK